jgi:two-component system chemotaxis response regulator CheB
MTNTLRVLVVDDTVTYRSIVSNALADTPGVEVVGVAANGRIALQKIEQLHPDLLTLDLEMPEMGGLELLRRLQSDGTDVGVIMLSAFTSEGAHSTVEALDLGAFDFVVKPNGGTTQTNAERLQRELRLKIDAFVRKRQIRTILRSSGVYHVGGNSPAARDGQRSPSGEFLPPGRLAASSSMSPCSASPGSVEIIVLGISTGGPQALTRMLPQLPGDLPAPVLIVQHMPPMFTRSLAEDLDRRCKLHVEEASDGQSVLPGTILIAPGGRHMRVEKTGETPLIRITDDPPENSCRPSVDHLFRSAAIAYGGCVLGVIMTGMGNDGTAGSKLLHTLGATILAQDEASCVVFGMPRDLVREGIARAVPLDEMAFEIVRHVGRGAAACR